MRNSFFALLALLALPAQASMAQTAIDLDAAPASFSRADYDTLLHCTLERHPDETRRYAEYHLNRREVQSPDVNAADPDSKLMIPAIQDCHRLEVGRPIPFSLDRLVADWADAHGIQGARANDPAPAVMVAPGVRDATEAEVAAFARCAWQEGPESAAQLLSSTGPVPMQAFVDVSRKCPMVNIKMDFEEFRAALATARPVEGSEQ